MKVLSARIRPDLSRTEVPRGSVGSTRVWSRRAREGLPVARKRTPRDEMVAAQTRLDRRSSSYIVAALSVFLVVLGWTYWNTVVSLVRIWTLDPQYSHGYLVPIFALVLLLFRRG